MSRRASLLLLLVALATVLLGTGSASAQPAPPGIDPGQVEEALEQVQAAPLPGPPGAGSDEATAAETGAAGSEFGSGGGEAGTVSDVGISVESDAASLSRTVVIILLLTVGSIAPGLLLLMTTFTRFVVVLGLVKNALGLQNVPPSQVLIGLALFLTFFVMSPVLSEVNEVAIQPVLAGDMEQGEAFQVGFEPVRRFMLAQTREEDLRLFVDLSNAQVANPSEVPASVLIPAFAISELRAAFIIGFIIYIPFLVVDLVVSAVLMSMGMMMLPPVFVSLPLKLLLFVLVDGWVLIVGSLVNSVDSVLV